VNLPPTPLPKEVDANTFSFIASRASQAIPEPGARECELVTGATRSQWTMSPPAIEHPSPDK
jgi:hypothetical protein